MIFQLVFSSRAHTRAFSTDDIHLLREAEHRNTALGLTGALVRVGERFVHVVEGDRAACLGLYQQVMRDPRHGDVRLIFQGDVTSRAFDGWDTGYGDSYDAGAAMAQTLTGGELRGCGAAYTTVLTAMKEIVRRYRAKDSVALPPLRRAA